MIVWQEIISEYGEVNCLLAVRAFTMGAERTVETTQLAPARLAASVMVVKN